MSLGEWENMSLDHYEGGLCHGGKIRTRGGKLLGLKNPIIRCEHGEAETSNINLKSIIEG